MAHMTVSDYDEGKIHSLVFRLAGCSEYASDTVPLCFAPVLGSRLA